MRRALSLATLVALVALGAGCSPARLDSFLYSPITDDAYVLSTKKIPGYSELSVPTSDGERIAAVYVPSSGKHADITLLYFHGQANDINTAWERIEFLYPLGYNLEVVDVRGYGKSTGTPTEAGLRIDELALREELLTRVGGTKLVYYGRSLGGALAIDLASVAAPSVLIEESTFTSVAAMVSDGAYADLPVGAVAASRWDSLGKIAHIASPFLALHGTADDYVQPKYSDELVAAHPGTSKLVRVEGADHGDVPQTMGLANYLQAIGDFVSANVK